MESATRSAEPTFVLPDSSPGEWCSAFSLPEQNKPARDLSSTGRVGLMETSLGQDTTTELPQVAPLIAGNGSPSGALLSGGIVRGEATARLGGQARTARPALGQCQHFSCEEQATQIKTLYCKHQGEYCDEHMVTAW